MLTIIETAGKSKSRTIIWLCKCQCGNYTKVRSDSLKSGTVKSCGCAKKHGMCFSRTYNSWYAMKQRCTNLNASSYPYYGGRGIEICKEWKAFKTFYEDMGERPPNTTLDRIDNEGNYEPANCKWSDKYEQARNRRKKSKK